MSNPILELFLNSKGKVLQNTPSGVTNWLSGTLINVDKGNIEIEFTVRANMCNPLQTLHGGTAAMIIDDVIGMCMFSLGLPHVYTSITLNVDFLRSVKLGEKITAKANVVKSGKQIININCCIYNASQKLVYKGHCNMMKNDNFSINLNT